MIFWEGRHGESGILNHVGDKYRSYYNTEWKGIDEIYYINGRNTYGNDTIVDKKNFLMKEEMLVGKYTNALLFLPSLVVITSIVSIMLTSMIT